MRRRFVRLRWWPAVCFAVLALVVLVGRVPPHAEAQPELPKYTMTVDFSPQTPPVKRGLICKDKEYQIEVRPVIEISQDITPVPLFGGRILSMMRPNLGTLNGTTKPSGVEAGASGPAVFRYRADETGQEMLDFGLLRFINPQIAQDPQYEEITNPDLTEILESKDFGFEVQDCEYEVSLVFTEILPPLATIFGIEAKTTLELQADGTFEGTGKFDYVWLTTGIPNCVFDPTRFTSQTHIHGTILKASNEMQLTFEFGDYVLTLAGKCFGYTGSVTDAGSDLAPWVNQATLSLDGGAKWFSVPISSLRGGFDVMFGPKLKSQ